MSNFPDFSRHGYQITQILGQNYQGGRVTYKAKSLTTQQPIVIKQFRFAHSGACWEDYDAYEREIEVLRSLNHVGIPQYLDSFQTSTGFCMVQEYKSAPSLAVSRRWYPEEIKHIALSVLEILVYLQSQTPLVIHRDLKPENILVNRQGRLKVTLVDFGFARIGGGEVAVSSSVKGTLGFMPPEQLFNRQLTAASDLYGLGATLICLLTGTPSAEIGKLMNADYQIHFKPLVSQLNPYWINWLQKMVAPNLKNRYANAAEAINALKPIGVYSLGTKIGIPGTTFILFRMSLLGLGVPFLIGLLGLSIAFMKTAPSTNPSAHEIIEP
ncbi:MAG: serine/threonine-protein kinase [Cyanobacteriota bacterium]